MWINFDMTNYMAVTADEMRDAAASMSEADPRRQHLLDAVGDHPASMVLYVDSQLLEGEPDADVQGQQGPEVDSGLDASEGEADS